MHTSSVCTKCQPLALNSSMTIPKHAHAIALIWQKLSTENGKKWIFIRICPMWPLIAAKKVNLGVRAIKIFTYWYVVSVYQPDSSDKLKISNVWITQSSISQRYFCGVKLADLDNINLLLNAKALIPIDSDACCGLFCWNCQKYQQHHNP